MLRTTLTLLAATSALTMTNVASAATNFIPTTGEYSTASNWDNGQPASGTGTTDAVVSAGKTAVVSSTTDLGSHTLWVAGTVDINADLIFKNNTGNRDVILGAYPGSGSTININDGGKLDIRGVGAFLLLGNAAYAGTDSVVNVFDGGTLRATKGVNVYDGTLFFADGSTSESMEDVLNFGNAGTLKFEIDAVGGNHATINGNDTQLNIDLAAGSTLEIDFSSGPTIGDAFILVQTWNTIDGTFGNVNVTGLAAGQQLDVVYDTDGEQIIAQVNAVPEPGSLALLGLGGLLIARRRRG